MDDWHSKDLGSGFICPPHSSTPVSSFASPQNLDETVFASEESQLEAEIAAWRRRHQFRFDPTHAGSSSSTQNNNPSGNDDGNIDSSRTCDDGVAAESPASLPGVGGGGRRSAGRREGQRRHTAKGSEVGSGHRSWHRQGGAGVSAAAAAHECSASTCTFHRIRDVFLCEQTGRMHGERCFQFPQPPSSDPSKALNPQSPNLVHPTVW